MQNSESVWSTIIVNLIFTVVPSLMMLLFGGGFGYLIYRWSKTHTYDVKRGQEIAKIAQALGWSFTQQSSIEKMPVLSHFKLQSGKFIGLENLALGKLDGQQAAFFDLVHDITTGRNSYRARQTVFALNSKALELPEFDLKPEGFLDSITTSDIDFQHRPDFSKKFFLTGNNTNAVRQIFSEPILDFYENVFPFHTTGGGSYIFIYLDENRIEPSQMNNWLQMLSHLGNLFSAATKKMPQISPVRNYP